MMKYIICILLGCLGKDITAQSNLDALLHRYTDNSVPYISIEELVMCKDEAVVLDSRSKKEYAVSHIATSIFVDYENFTLDTFKKIYPNQNTLIVVYCSVGVRSHTTGKKLINAGYKNVKNLYGGIFEWKNMNLPIINRNAIETDSLHTYSEQWSKYSKNAINVF
ncbi:rhodanese-like domain-containing protein [Aquimarina intermedia]|uniref:Rhodanese-related sulfurtransferase n=1 Tax=Aquimarina intermedia TaxID=350814 RepID=A0A5S5CFH1_9FLAO|nr:rhodanese-like domain-containing protein [Aquimarina intermedia]TYP77262.1 rhodanese-related sulfurtransferase [Aquimarina intermedia]